MDRQHIVALFTEYFKKHHHQLVPSSSCVPSQDDESLLFVNAGMAPFKRIFSGDIKAPHPRVISIQRCLRAGGKHNDLDNVGYTARHHTFFEMLGNFSFGDYFKAKAIRLAWDFLTDILKLPADRLWITVFEEDKETEDIWLKDIQINPSRLSRCGKEDNFWSMGETGPCGPCTEIFYDYGPTVAGGPPGSDTADGDRYVEIWNLVFMQYERTIAKSLIPLATPGVDTGMGLERLAAVMQGVTNNYETDLFQPLIKAVAHLMPASQNTRPQTLQVIADHIRAITFLIFDGILPSNEGRAYVLRRIIRRALRHGYQAGLKKPFLHQLIPTFIQQMDKAYPELRAAQPHIIKTVLIEEQKFLQTLKHGLQYFEKALLTSKNCTISGSLVFKLYDTYGFPTDLTADLAKERGFQWDQVGFEQEMHAQKNRSKQASHFKNAITSEKILMTGFVGYTHLQVQSRIIALFNDMHQPVEALNVGEKGVIILDKTPFYAQAGGQVGDQGALVDGKNQFEVLDTQKQGALHQHIGQVTAGTLKVLQNIQASINTKRRKAITQHHTATHLLQAALKYILSDDITQQGSLVTPSYLRFDFNYALPMTQADIDNIESRINQIIWENVKGNIKLMSLASAQQLGAIALFNEKYQELVRVLQIGDFSTELCGGTHVAHTGELGLFKITSVSTIASGIKRIEALVGEASFNWVKQKEQQQLAIASLLKTDPAHIMPRLSKQLTTYKQQATEISELQQYLLRNLKKELLKNILAIENVKLVVFELPNLLATQTRMLIDQLKTSITGPLIIVLGCFVYDKIQMSIGISKNCLSIVTSKELIDLLAPMIKAKGGGRPDFAYLQGTYGDQRILQQALQAIAPWLKQYLSAQSLNITS